MRLVEVAIGAIRANDIREFVRRAREPQCGRLPDGDAIDFDIELSANLFTLSNLRNPRQ